MCFLLLLLVHIYLSVSECSQLARGLHYSLQKELECNHNAQRNFMFQINQIIIVTSHYKMGIQLVINIANSYHHQRHHYHPAYDATLYHLVL